ncbi:AraC family transcriptional regulator [Roseateles koreensis]|uniref:AraC family transcriptional regulator n=1 Tax=Roseateles koreensis TaxID=2987526 RepID=A0ABT5KTT3_9BURK|nr:AraC family transcriptional regulator [Roseateles koreensis]MDC8786348.1 AraC family transcriptional regulator [Roseateles koreensis]
MIRPPTTIPIAYVHAMLEAVRARGIALDCFLADAGIVPELLAQSSSRVTVEQYIELFKSLVNRLDDDLLGLQSRALKRGSFVLMARSAIGAPTLEVAIRRIARTYRLLQDDVLIKTVRDGALAGVTLHYTDPSAKWPNFLPELLLRVLWQLIAWLAGGKLRVARFDFAFAPPYYADTYAQAFPGKLAFNCEQSGFWFDASYLQNRVRQDEQSLFNYLSNAQKNVFMPQKSTDAMSADVRRHLQRRLPEWSDLVATAEALHISSATLQRRLAAEGTTFRVLKDSLRRDMAIVRLNTSSIPLEALALELGFADSASFQRAFKNWTGCAPGTYRRQEAVKGLPR